MAKVTLLDKLGTCATGSKAEKLYRWPGSVAGYVKDGKYYKGTSTTDTNLPAKSSFFANNWKGA